jgi:preprotein translocase subunit SecD
VHLTLDAKGARILRDVTRENIGKRMAILLFEKGKGEVVTAPVIQAEIGGGRVQISGRMTTAEASRHRAAAARRLAGRADGDHRGAHHRPEPGRREHRQGLQQRGVRLPGHRVFMCAYYLLFGVFSTLALGFNLLLLVAVLSMLQATLTLPGMPPSR